MQSIINIPKTLLIAAIDFYQSVFSPDHSWLKVRFPYGYCRHYPSCSQYSRQAIEKFGSVKGLWLSAKRLLKCHPWSEPKVDLIPNT